MKTETKTIVIFVCPTPGCPDYFGSTAMGNLAEKNTGPKDEDRHQVSKEDSRVGVAGMRHNRAECPTCRARGSFVQRVPLSVSVAVPVV